MPPCFIKIDFYSRFIDCEQLNVIVKSLNNIINNVILIKV